MHAKSNQLNLQWHQSQHAATRYFARRLGNFIAHSASYTMQVVLNVRTKLISCTVHKDKIYFIPAACAPVLKLIYQGGFFVSSPCNRQFIELTCQDGMCHNANKNMLHQYAFSARIGQPVYPVLNRFKPRYLLKKTYSYMHTLLNVFVK